ncbi:MAG: chloride channel protein [Thermoprotei archaeon]
MRINTSIEIRTLIHKWILIPVIIGAAIGLAEAAFVELYDLIWDESYPYLLTPAIFVVIPLGLLTAYSIITILGKSSPGSTTHEVLRRFHYEDGRGDARNSITSPISSAVTMGVGGSAGLEGPSLSIGGSISYRLSNLLGVKGNDARILFLAGAGAALGAVLKAPLTGILFAIEVPYRQDLEHHVFLPAIPMAVISYLIYIAILGQTPIFQFTSSTLFPTDLELIFSVVEGLFLGGLALAFVYVYKYAQKFAPSSFSTKGLLTVICAGVLVAFIGYFEPMTLGVGYPTISASINATSLNGIWKYGAIFILVLVFAKIITTSTTLNGGGSGGLFIPSIFIGAVASVGFMKALGLPFSAILVAAGAAAMVAATNKTILAAVAFVAETMTPAAIIPALLAAATAYILTGNKGLYDNQLDFSPARTHLALLRLSHKSEEGPNTLITDVMRPARFRLLPDDHPAKAFSLFSLAGDTALPIVSKDGKYLGRLELENLVASPLSSINDLMIIDKPLKTNDEEIKAANRIIQSGKGILFVVDNDGMLKGVLRTSDLIKSYSKKITQNLSQ